MYYIPICVCVCVCVCIRNVVLEKDGEDQLDRSREK
jgi:hypothetical protein